METFPEDPFETVKPRIASSGERQAIGVLGGMMVGVVETTDSKMKYLSFM